MSSGPPVKRLKQTCLSFVKETGRSTLGTHAAVALDFRFFTYRSPQPKSPGWFPVVTVRIRGRLLEFGLGNTRNPILLLNTIGPRWRLRTPKRTLNPTIIIIIIIGLTQANCHL